MDRGYPKGRSDRSDPAKGETRSIELTEQSGHRAAEQVRVPGWKVKVQGSPPGAVERFEVPQRLGLLQNAEGVRFAGNGEIL